MNVLVTGGCGFIGNHLVKSLIDKGFSVTIFDNFSNSLENSKSSFLKNSVKVIEGDITNIEQIENATKNQNIVVHLAAKISVLESTKNPLETFRINVEGTKNVLSSCNKNNVKKVIVASSAAVYGEIDSSKEKLTENSKTAPISPYGESKLEMEKVIKDFCNQYNINYSILRIFNIYGPNQSDEYAGVITKFLDKITNNNEPEIFGDGLQTRDFVAIHDVIDAIHNSISVNKNGIYNIASGKAVSIKELAELMISIYKKNLQIKYSHAKKEDILFSQADITLAKKELGYTPKFELSKIKEVLQS